MKRASARKRMDLQIYSNRTAVQLKCTNRRGKGEKGRRWEQRKSACCLRGEKKSNIFNGEGPLEKGPGECGTRRMKYGLHCEK